MKQRIHILAIFMACLLLSGCASESQNDLPASLSNVEQSVVFTESEQKEKPVEDIQPPAEEVPTGPIQPEPSTNLQPDATASATPKTENPPEPVEPESTQIAEAVNNCSISINCTTVLDNLDALTQGKEELVPADGWLLNPVEVTFHEGENVFQVLSRVCKQEKLHMEFADTPGYDSAYIEGIGNIYEFDCGPLSGWKYRVNGWFPNYGCSRYQVQSGDVIEWLYTCDLGADIGGGEGQ